MGAGTRQGTGHVQFPRLHVVLEEDEKGTMVGDVQDDATAAVPGLAQNVRFGSLFQLEDPLHLGTHLPGLDQVNCQIPAGLSGNAVPVVITAAGRVSNTVTLAIRGPV